VTAADLTEPVNAAAESQFGIDAARLGIESERLRWAWDDAKPAVKHAYRESVSGPVAAAAPVIEAQVRAQATRLEPWESMALAVATARLDRGEAPTPVAAAVCIGALERIARGAA